MQLVHVAFGERDDPHAGKARALVDMGDILLVARQPVDCFGNDHVELAGLRILQEHLHTRTDQARAGNRMIGVAVDDPPAFALRALLAQANLVLDRGVALQIGGIAGVDGGSRHDECLSLFALSPGCLSLGFLAAELSIISLGGGACKQPYQLDEHRIGRGGVIPRLFCLPTLLTLAHATNLEAWGASFPRANLAPVSRQQTAPALGRGGAGWARRPRRPGLRAPHRYRPADDLQIEQRVAALDRARRAAIQIVPSPVTQAPQLKIAEV